MKSSIHQIEYVLNDLGSNHFSLFREIRQVFENQYCTIKENFEDLLPSMLGPILKFNDYNKFTATVEHTINIEFLVDQLKVIAEFNKESFKLINLTVEKNYDVLFSFIVLKDSVLVNGCYIPKDVSTITSGHDFNTDRVLTNYHNIIIGTMIYA